MNKIYRVVWNKATQTWIAVCEYANAHGKSSGSEVVGEMSDKRMGERFAYTMVMSGLLIATGQVAYAATVADGTGLNAIVIQGASSTATATGADSLAAGTNAAADGTSALAIGTNVTAGGLNSIAIGGSNNVTGGYTTVIGSDNIPKDGKGVDANGDIVDVTAAGTITATHSSIIGTSNKIAVSSVIGTPPPYAGALTDVQVQGNKNTINRGRAYVFGSENTINTNASNMELESVVAVGYQNTVSGNNSLAVGRLNTVAGGSALAVGINSQALGTDGIAIGNKAYANRGENAVALGGLTHAGQFGTALGARTSVEGDQGAAVATGAVVKGARAVAVGSYSFAGTEDAVALGHNTAATGSRAVAIGAGSVVSGARSGVWGVASGGGQPQNNTTDRSFVGGTDSYAIGNKNIIGNTSSDSFVLGNNVKLGATGASIAITNVAGRDGTTNASTRTNAVTYTGATAITGAVALGSDTSVTVNNGVALGKSSVASTAAGQTGADPLNAATDKTTSTWAATHAAVSVGNGTTVTRQITSVAAGTQDTDAVNVAQLKAAGFTLAASHTGGGESTTVADDKIQNGETVTVDAGKNIKVTHTANQVSIATKDEVEFTKITLGDSTNNTVLTSTTDSLDVGGDKITNVANGDVSASSTDAINGSQLYTTNQNVANNTTAIANNAALIAKGINFGGTTGSNNYALGDTINVKGDSNISSETVAGGVQLKLNDVVNIGTAKPVKIDGTAGTVGGLTNTTWDANNIVSGQAATEDQLKSAVSAAQAAATTKVAEGKNIKVSKQPNADGSTTYTVATADDLDVTSVKAGNTTLNNAGVAVGNDVTLTNTGLTAGDVKVSTDGINAGNKAITGVAAGTKDTDAVNVSQLKAAQAAATTKVEGDKGVSVTPKTNTDGSTTYTVAAKTDGITTTIDGKGNIAAVTAPLTTNTDGKVNTPAAPNALATAGDIANAINNSGFTLTAQGSDGSLVKPGATVDMNNTDGNIVISKSASDNKVTYNLAKDLKVDSVTAGDTVVNNDGITINNGSANGNTVSLTKDGLNNGGNRITNVAPGVNGTDAVNVNQLNSVASNINNRITTVGNIANAGVAQAIATAGLPQAYLPGKNMMAIAGGTYEGEAGYAIGFSTISDNGKWIIKATGSGNSRGKFGASIGAGYQW